MMMTVEVGYDDVAEQKLGELRDEVGPSKTEIKSVKIVTG